jgi:hypothetical protein
MHPAALAHEIGKRVPTGLRPLARRQLVRFRHRGLTAADTVLVSYPKSGSTWLRFLLGHVLGGRELDFDSVRDVLPPVGHHQRAPRLLPDGGRLVRSHEPLGALPGHPALSVLYLVRDGRDVAVSYLHHMRRVGRFDGDLAAFLPQFLSGAVDSYGPWHAHALEAAARREDGHPSPLIIRYEDLRHDSVGELARIATFLGVAPDAGALEAAVAANAKDRMRAKERTSRILQSQNADGSSFVRSDVRRSWNELVDPATTREFERVAGAALRAFGYLETAP